MSETKTPIWITLESIMTPEERVVCAISPDRDDVVNVTRAVCELQNQIKDIKDSYRRLKQVLGLKTVYVGMFQHEMNELMERLEAL